MGILGDYLPNWLPSDPNQNTAARQGLLSAGAALLGGRGDLGSILAGGLMAGQQGYNGALQQQQQAALMAAQQKRLDVENQQNQAALDQDKAISSGLADFNSKQGQNAVPSFATGLQQTVPALSATPQASPAPDAARPLSMLPQSSAAPILPISALPQINAPAPTPDPSSDYQAVEARAKYLNTYFPGSKQAAAALKAVEQFKPEVRDVVEMQVGGKRVMVQTFKDGRPPQILDGYSPKAEKLNFQNTGGSTVALDPFTGKPVSTIQNTVSPDAKYSRETQYGVQGLINQRNEVDNKTQIVQSDEGPILVNKTTGTGIAVTGPNGQRLAGVSKPLNDSQSKALLFGTRMQEAHKVLQQLSAEGTNKSIVGSRAPIVGGLISALAPEDWQMLDQAKRDFINATLRRESGAAIANSEFENGEKQYFPQIGDSAKVIAQKARNRELAIKGVLVEVPEKQRASITPLDQVPKKAPAAGAHPTDITNLLNKYGSR